MEPIIQISLDLTQIDEALAVARAAVRAHPAALVRVWPRCEPSGLMFGTIYTHIYTACCNRL